MNPIKKLLLDLVKIESVTASPDGERECAQFIFDWLGELEYFKKNPHLLQKIKVEGKNYFAVSALVKAAKPTNRTVILTGHFDVVSSEDCGAIKQWAFDPEEYTKRIAELKITSEAREDLQSGHYLFGRGVADMKLGIALEMNILQEFSHTQNMFDINILFLAVPDEEGDSFGMRAAVAHLLQMQNEGLNLLAYVNTEPSFVNKEHKNDAAIFDGTIGKMMPFFMCVGRETHVGKYYDGLNSLLIASYLNISLEDGETKFACLYMRDQRKSYAVTLPERTVMYFNHLYTEGSPEKILEIMREKAYTALQKAITHSKQNYEPRVISVSELIAAAASRSGDILEKLSENLPPDIKGERERNIEIVHRLIDFLAEKGPFVVVGFIPPFYPSRKNKNESENEVNLERAVQELSVFAEKEFATPIYRAGIMGGITDLSYTGFDGDAAELETLSKNIPLWGRGYEIPIEALSKINIPVLNLGPIGKDCHKLTERADMNFSLNILPNLLVRLIKSL